jgi:DNA-binding transcriptional ArsR family regulator
MRVRLLDALRSREEASVQELAEALDAGHANVSKHLGILHAQRILGRRKQGTRVLYRIVDPSVLGVCDQICGAVHEQLRELAALVGGPPAGEGEASRSPVTLAQPTTTEAQEGTG